MAPKPPLKGAEASKKKGDSGKKQDSSRPSSARKEKGSATKAGAKGGGKKKKSKSSSELSSLTEEASAPGATETEVETEEVATAMDALDISDAMAAEGAPPEAELEPAVPGAAELAAGAAPVPMEDAYAIPPSEPSGFSEAAAAMEVPAAPATEPAAVPVAEPAAEQASATESASTEALSEFVSEISAATRSAVASPSTGPYTVVMEMEGDNIDTFVLRIEGGDGETLAAPPAA